MTQPENQDLDVDALMRQIRKEIASRTARPRVSGQGRSGTNPSGTGDHGTFDGERVTLSRLAESAAAIPRKREYTVGEFLSYYDEDFVRNAYRGLLGREPDAEGARRFLAALRSGDLAKVEVLGRIRFSPEGRAAGVRVSGLRFPFAMRTLRRIPLLGHVLGIIQHFFRLPNIVRRHERLENVVFLHQLEMRRGVNALDAEIEAALQRLQDLIAGSLDAIEEKIAAHGVTTSASLDGIAERLELMTVRLAAKADRSEIETLEQRILDAIHAQIAQIQVTARNADAELVALRSIVEAMKRGRGQLEREAVDREGTKGAS
jgi:hypothetical protein